MRDKGFIDSDLVGTGDKLSMKMPDTEFSEPERSGSDVSASPRGGNRTVARRGESTLEIKDNEWKKAIFRSWDEFKVARREVTPRLRGLLDSIPAEIASSEKRIVDLTSAADNLGALLADIEGIDDSTWDRHSLQSELAVAAKKVENARIECMLFVSKFSDGTSGEGSARSQLSSSNGNSIIHELTSLSFKQAVKLGWGFLFPLVAGVILGALLLSLMNYLTVHF
jgi:hypothetical protein